MAVCIPAAVQVYDTDEDWKNGVCATDPARFSATIAERQQELENERRPGRGPFRTVYSLNVIFVIHFLPVCRISRCLQN